jgi:gluconate 2-dehydrogenase gamma chain
MDELEPVEDPQEQPGLSRRDLLRRAGIAGVAVAVPAAGAAVATVGDGAQAAPQAAPEREQREAFTADESDTLEAILERLIPSDDSGAGAREASVGRYIDRALGGALAHLAPFYSASLAALDAYAQATQGAPFASLPPDKQDVVLGDLEADTATGFNPSASAFFETVREHALQGMFGDPYYGGNANFAGWDLIGFPGIKLTVPAKDQRIGATVTAVHKSTYDYEMFRRPARGTARHEH